MSFETKNNTTTSTSKGAAAPQKPTEAKMLAAYREASTTGAWVAHGTYSNALLNLAYKKIAEEQGVTVDAVKKALIVFIVNNSVSSAVFSDGSVNVVIEDEVTGDLKTVGAGVFFGTIAGELGISLADLALRRLVHGNEQLVFPAYQLLMQINSLRHEKYRENVIALLGNASQRVFKALAEKSQLRLQEIKDDESYAI